MKNKRTLFIFLLVFVLLLGGAYMAYEKLGLKIDANQLTVQASADPQDSEGDTEEQKPVAPDFTVYDIEGNAVHLSDYIGKPIVLNFWASWCGPCQMEMPDFHAKYLEIGQDIHFIMVNVTSGRETVDSATAFVSDKGYTFPIFFDKDSDAARAYGAYSLPTTFFIDSEGYVIAQAIGSIDSETLQRGIDMIIELGQ